MSANCGYLMGPSINDLERKFKHVTPSCGMTYIDDNGIPGRGNIFGDDVHFIFITEKFQNLK